MNDQKKRNKFKRFADTFFDSCIETWKKTKTGIAPESWTWNPKDNQLEIKLMDLFENTLETSEAVKKLRTVDKTEKTTSKRDVTRTFKIDNSYYDLRPGTF
jgi:mannosyl-oligosaccharide alpha-1,2-mannosidase